MGLRRRLKNLETAHSVVRHVTRPYLTGLLDEVLQELLWRRLRQASLVDDYLVGDDETIAMSMSLPISEAASKQQPADSDTEHSIPDAEREMGVPFLGACAHGG